jgi:hypothetical protein
MCHRLLFRFLLCTWALLALTVVQTAGRAACGLDVLDNEANTLFQSLDSEAGYDVTTGDCTLE